MDKNSKKAGHFEEKIHFCNLCNVKCCNLYKLRRHNMTAHHIKKAGNNGERVGNKFYYCLCCHFDGRDKTEFERHKKTIKHLNNENKQKDEIIQGYKNELNELNQKKIYREEVGSKNYYCLCCHFRGRDKTEIKRHIKTKKHMNNEIKQKDETIIKCKDEIIQSKEDMLVLYINQNKEFQSFMLEQMKIIQEKQLTEQITTTTNNIAMNNCNNKTFNLQFFLNETCKDAMNLSDFINNINIEVEDLIDSPIGYVKCITSQFMKFYKQLPIEKRPFHCSDEKRRSLHVKENGEWAIDHCEAKIRKAVKSISHKNICRLVSWKKIHVDYYDSESFSNTQYISIIQNCCAGKDDFEIEKNEMKVVFNLIKESVIDKKHFLK
jgi:hypothetical protein